MCCSVLVLPEMTGVPVRGAVFYTLTYSLTLYLYSYVSTSTRAGRCWQDSPTYCSTGQKPTPRRNNGHALTCVMQLQRLLHVSVRATQEEQGGEHQIAV